MEERFTVMLIEDDSAHAELIMRSIRMIGIIDDIIHLEDGEMVLDYLRNIGQFKNKEKFKRPHLILLDLRLPKIDGLDVLMEIKKHTDFLDIPVVILTTSNAEQDIIRAYQNHANSYLVKPIEFKLFEKLLYDLGIYWLKLNKRPKEFAGV